MNNEKEEFRNEVNKIIDEEEDINKFFSCAEISQSCNPLKHCCGNYQCSGMVNVPDLFVVLYIYCILNLLFFYFLNFYIYITSFTFYYLCLKILFL